MRAWLGAALLAAFLVGGCVGSAPAACGASEPPDDLPAWPLQQPFTGSAESLARRMADAVGDPLADGPARWVEDELEEWDRAPPLVQEWPTRNGTIRVYTADSSHGVGVEYRMASLWPAPLERTHPASLRHHLAGFGWPDGMAWSGLEWQERTFGHHTPTHPRVVPLPGESAWSEWQVFRDPATMAEEVRVEPVVHAFQSPNGTRVSVLAPHDLSGLRPTLSTDEAGALAKLHVRCVLDGQGHTADKGYWVSPPVLERLDLEGPGAYVFQVDHAAARFAEGETCRGGMSVSVDVRDATLRRGGYSSQSCAFYAEEGLGPRP